VVGLFTDAARIQTSSGAVTTSSGDIRVRDLALTNQHQERRRLTGSLGMGAGTLTIQTSSGDVLLAAQ